jgi:aryl-alcohol dehydrogenase-like predicted oxidoreductase
VKYRFLENINQGVSVVGMLVGESSDSLLTNRSIISSAIGCGINFFQVPIENHSALTAMGEVCRGLNRNQIVVGLRSRAGSREASAHDIRAKLLAARFISGLDWFNYLLFESPDPVEISSGLLSELDAEIAEGKLKYIGISGENKFIDRYISSNKFQIFSSSYNIYHNIDVRNRIKLANAHNMAIIGANPTPIVRVPCAPEPIKSGLLNDISGLFRSQSLPGDVSKSGFHRGGGFTFLHEEDGWNAENLCLAYALAEPSLSTLLVSPDSTSSIEQFANTSKRTIPFYIPAKIEIARAVPD